MSIFQNAIPKYFISYLGEPDKRVKEWFLLNTPISMITIVTMYFSTLLILYKFMENRKALELRKLLVLYNAFQVLYSSYICKEIFVSAYLSKYKWTCAVFDTYTKVGLRMAHAFWLFYLSKVIDLADTIFFILRKKHRQISFLHVYHHSTMIFNWYLGVLYSPGGQAFFSVLFNAFVHVIMYLYYMLSAFGPKMKKYLWWKKYLTQIQLIQFIAVIGHLCIGLYNKCRAPVWLTWFTITYLSTLVILFANFYYKAYKVKKTNEREISTTSDYKASGDFKYKSM